MKEQPWYKLRPLLGNTWAIFYILVGSRECGKSFAVMDYLLYHFFKYGKPFIWLRLKPKQVDNLLANNAEKLFDPELRRKYGLTDEDIKRRGRTVYFRGIKMCTCMSIAGFYDDKGTGLFDSEFKIFRKKGKKDHTDMFPFHIAVDEFQREKNENRTFDIVYAFTNQLENLLRHRSDARIFLMGNTLEEASDILTVFDFIPTNFGITKIKKRRCIIDNIRPSAAYKELRKSAVASLLTPNASTFTNVLAYDDSRIQKPSHKVSYILQFETTMYCLHSNNTISRYKGQSAPVIPLLPLLSGNSVYQKEQVLMVKERIYSRSFYFANVLVQKKFESDVRILKRF